MNDDIIYYTKKFLNVKSLGLLSQTNKKNKEIIINDLEKYKIIYDNIINLLNNKKTFLNDLFFKSDVEKIFKSKLNYINNNHPELEMIVYNIIETNCNYNNINITNDSIIFTNNQKIFFLNISIDNDCLKYMNITYNY